MKLTTLSLAFTVFISATTANRVIKTYDDGMMPSQIPSPKWVIPNPYLCYLS